MNTRLIALIAAATLFSVPAAAQRVSPMGVTCCTSTLRTINPAAIAPRDDPMGRAPYIVFGALIGAGAVGTYWVHEIRVSAKQNGNDGFFIPPIVYITIGAGGLAGGVLGSMIHDAIYE